MFALKEVEGRENAMKRYSLPYLSRDQIKLIEAILLEEMELQTWYSIVVLTFLKEEDFVCLQ